MAKALVIVESPAKARTLARLLGDRYRVEASVGHVRDLPENASEVPAAIKDKPWGRMGVDVDNGFRPVLRHLPRQGEPHPRPARRREGCARGAAGHRPGSRGRVDQLAPAGGAQAEGPRPAHRVPRDHRSRPSSRPSRRRATSTCSSSTRRRAGASSTGCTATWCRPCSGRRCRPGSAPAACRAWRCASSSSARKRAAHSGRAPTGTSRRA